MSDVIGRLLQNVINLERLSNTVAAESDVRVQQLMAQIAEDLARVDITGVSAASYQAQRLTKFLNLLEERIKVYQSAEAVALKDRLALIGRFQAKLAENELLATLGSVAKKVHFTPVTQSRIRAILNEDPFQGRILSEHIDRVGQNVYVRIRDQIRMGMVQEESVGDLVRRVRGKQLGWTYIDPETGAIVARGSAGARAVPRFTGGVVDTTTRETEALVRTAVTFVSNKGALATFEENKSLLSGVEYTAVLDDRTTVLCASLDGTEWPVGSPDIVIPGEATHWNCRSILVPVVNWGTLGLTPPPEPDRSARDLRGVSTEDLDRKVSARRRTGDLGKVTKVSSNVRAEDWLRKQPVRVQDKMLGKGRAALWRDGKFTLAEMIKQDNTVISLHELTAN